jgi:hypothetical protein
MDCERHTLQNPSIQRDPLLRLITGPVYPTHPASSGAHPNPTTATFNHITTLQNPRSDDISRWDILIILYSQTFIILHQYNSMQMAMDSNS